MYYESGPKVGCLFIVFFAEILHHPSLADLSCPFKYQRPAVRSVFPMNQLLFYYSMKFHIPITFVYLTKLIKLFFKCKCSHILTSENVRNITFPHPKM